MKKIPYHENHTYLWVESQRGGAKFSNRKEGWTVDSLNFKFFSFLVGNLQIFCKFDPLPPLRLDTEDLWEGHPLWTHIIRGGGTIFT